MVPVLTTIVLLLASRVVFASTNPSLNGEIRMPCTSLSAENRSKSGKLMRVIPPARNDLPLAPLLSTDVLPGSSVNKSRNPLYLKNANTPKIGQKSLEVIPNGLRKFWNQVKAECSWFYENESLTLIKLFEFIINDKYEDFVSFEDDFRNTFNVSYANFSQKGRTMMDWLISFGAINILRSVDLENYQISQEGLEKSMNFLFSTNRPHFVARIFEQCPFLFEYNIFRIPGFDLLNFSVLLSEITKIDDFKMILNLIPLLEKGQEVKGLISISSTIVNHLINPGADIHMFSLKIDRRLTVKSFKETLSKFFLLTIPSFASLGNSELFSLSRLFMEVGSVEGLQKVLDANTNLIYEYGRGKRVIDTDPQFIFENGNSKNLLQISIESSTYLNCVSFLVQRNPKSVIEPVNQLQSPFVQAVHYNNMNYFDIFYPALSNNEKLIVHGVDQQLSPISIVMIYGNSEMLRKLVDHFKATNVPYNLRNEFETVMVFLIRSYKLSEGESTHRLKSLMSHEIWLYLLDEAKIEVGPTVDSSITLLELAIHDRNPEVVKKLLSDERIDVNRTYESRFFKGNCLLLIKADLVVMKLIVEKGAKLDLPIEKYTFTNGSSTPQTEIISLYDHLIAFTNPEFTEYLNSLNLEHQ